VVPFASGPTDADVPTSEESLTTKVVNAEVVETWTWYFVAPALVAQLKVSVVACAVAPFEGDERDGVEGTARAIVVKLKIDPFCVPTLFCPTAR